MTIWTDRQTLNVAFATQKGGSGKTAITVLVAGYLHYRLGCPLAVIDCDFPQYSLYEMRERDSRAVLENEHLKRAAYEQMRQPGRAAYPVRKCRVEQVHGVVCVRVTSMFPAFISCMKVLARFSSLGASAKGMWFPPRNQYLLPFR